MTERDELGQELVDAIADLRSYSARAAAGTEDAETMERRANDAVARIWNVVKRIEKLAAG
jgi:hypothetical protein